MNYGDEAAKLVLGDRNASYGHPALDYGKTSAMWSGYLLNKLKPGAAITPKDAVLMMVLLKVSREENKAKPDNLIDAHGYLLLAEWIETGVMPMALAMTFEKEINAKIETELSAYKAESTKKDNK